MIIGALPQHLEHCQPFVVADHRLAIDQKRCRAGNEARELTRDLLTTCLSLLLELVNLGLERIDSQFHLIELLPSLPLPHQGYNHNNCQTD